MARTYKRDSRGRFASGGGSSGGRKASGTSGKAKAGSSGGGRKRNKARVTTTGTFLTRGRAKIAQRERYKQFNSKTQASSARNAYKAAARGARVSQKKAGAARTATSSAKKKVTPKISLTMAELSSRMLGEAPRMSKGRGGMPVTGDTSVKAGRRRNARQAQADFRSYLRTTATATARARGAKGPISNAELDKLFVSAFKNRPRYSTKQRVRPDWVRRQSDALRQWR